jgi:hypothetical protein
MKKCAIHKRPLGQGGCKACLKRWFTRYRVKDSPLRVSDEEASRQLLLWLRSRGLFTNWVV